MVCLFSIDSNVKKENDDTHQSSCQTWQNCGGNIRPGFFGWKLWHCDVWPAIEWPWGVWLLGHDPWVDSQIYLFVFWCILFIHIPSSYKSTYLPKFPMVPKKLKVIDFRSHEMAVITTILGFYALGYGAVTSAMPALTRPGFDHPIPVTWWTSSNWYWKSNIYSRLWEVNYKDYNMDHFQYIQWAKKSSSVNLRA